MNIKIFFQQLRLPWLNDLLTKLATSTGKKSILVFRKDRYLNVPNGKTLPSSISSMNQQ
jgi:hypothetical protein